MLGIILSPWAKRYTITDLDYLVPLIRKNVAANQEIIQKITLQARACRNMTDTQDNNIPISGNIDVDSLDWRSIQPAMRMPTSRKPTWPLQANDAVDLIIAVDCIYNPSLIPAFLNTLDFFATDRTAKTEGSEGRTNEIPSVRRPCVLVAAELRSEDVIREFLGQWLARDAWEIWRVDWEPMECDEGYVGNRAPVEAGLDVCFVIWVGWKAEHQ
jgi:hypothetical protein